MKTKNLIISICGIVTGVPYTASGNSDLNCKDGATVISEYIQNMDTNAIKRFGSELYYLDAVPKTKDLRKNLIEELILKGRVKNEKSQETAPKTTRSESGTL